MMLLLLKSHTAVRQNVSKSDSDRLQHSSKKYLTSNLQLRELMTVYMYFSRN